MQALRSITVVGLFFAYAIPERVSGISRLTGLQAIFSAENVKRYHHALETLTTAHHAMLDEILSLTDTR